MSRISSADDLYRILTRHKWLCNGSVIEAANGKRAQLQDSSDFIWTMISPDGRSTSTMRLQSWDKSCFPMMILWEPDEDIESSFLPHATFSEDGEPLLTAVQYEAQQDGSANALLGGAL